MSCKFSVRNGDDNVCAFSMNKPIVVTCDGEEYEKEDCPFWNGLFSKM